MTIQGENSVIFAGWREDGHKARRAEFIKHPQELGGASSWDGPAALGSQGEHKAALPHPGAHRPNI